MTVWTALPLRKRGGCGQIRDPDHMEVLLLPSSHQPFPPRVDQQALVRAGCVEASVRLSVPGPGLDEQLMYLIDPVCLPGAGITGLPGPSSLPSLAQPQSWDPVRTSG